MSGMLLDFIYSVMDRWLCEGRYELCDEFMRSIHQPDISTDAILGILTITLAAADKLKARQKFYADAKALLILRHKDSDELLQGLSGEVGS